MRFFRSNGGCTAQRLGAAAAVVSLTAALPLVAGGTAHANPNSSRVVVTGIASCARFPQPHRSSVTDVTIAPLHRAPKTVELSGEQRAERYVLVFTNVPRLPGGLPAVATVSCLDRHGHQYKYSKNFVIQRPRGMTHLQILNLR